MAVHSTYTDHLLLADGLFFLPFLAANLRASPLAQPQQQRRRDRLVKGLKEGRPYGVMVPVAVAEFELIEYEPAPVVMDKVPVVVRVFPRMVTDPL